MRFIRPLAKIICVNKPRKKTKKKNNENNREVKRNPKTYLQ